MGTEPSKPSCYINPFNTPDCSYFQWQKKTPDGEVLIEPFRFCYAQEGEILDAAQVRPSRERARYDLMQQVRIWTFVVDVRNHIYRPDASVKSVTSLEDWQKWRRFKRGDALGDSKTVGELTELPRRLLPRYAALTRLFQRWGGVRILALIEIILDYFFPEFEVEAEGDSKPTNATQPLTFPAFVFRIEAAIPKRLSLISMNPEFASFIVSIVAVALHPWVSILTIKSGRRMRVTKVDFSLQRKGCGNCELDIQATLPRPLAVSIAIFKIYFGQNQRVSMTPLMLAQDWCPNRTTIRAPFGDSQGYKMVCSHSEMSALSSPIPVQLCFGNHCGIHIGSVCFDQRGNPGVEFRERSGILPHGFEEKWGRSRFPRLTWLGLSHPKIS